MPGKARTYEVISYPNLRLKDLIEIAAQAQALGLPLDSNIRVKLAGNQSRQGGVRVLAVVELLVDEEQP